MKKSTAEISIFSFICLVALSACANPPINGIVEETKKLPAAVGPDPRPFVIPSSYVCMKTAEPLVIDGKVDESSWQKAAWTKSFVDIEGSMNSVMPRFEARTKMLWDDEYFYVAAKLFEPHIWATITKRNTAIYQDNAFEVFIDPDGDCHSYYEFQMNALNTLWNLYFNRPYKNGGSGNVREMPGQKSAVYVNGTLNDPTDEDEYWAVEIAFPWAAMKQYANVICPPQNNNQWRMNFVRVQWQHRVVDGKYERVPQKGVKSDICEDYWVWSPQGLVSMHRPETWGIVQFSDKPVGTQKVNFINDGQGNIRYLLSKIMYAQKEYYLNNSKYAETVEDLKIDLIDEKIVTIIKNDNGFIASCTAHLEGGTNETMMIDQNGRISTK